MEDGIIRERILKLYGFLDRHRALFDAHSVDFFTADHWNSVVPEEWRSLAECRPSDAVFLHPTSHSSSDIPATFHQFLLDSCNLRLPGLLDSSQVEDEAVGGGLGTSEAVGGGLASFGMSKKKSHEVNRLSKVVAKVMAKNNLTQVLDLGSGKGYLSEFLALQYGYTVVGVDSQQINTDGATKRNDKVCKVWKSHSNNNTENQKTLPEDSDSGEGLQLDEDLFLGNLFEPILNSQIPTSKEPLSTCSTIQSKASTCEDNMLDVDDSNKFKSSKDSSVFSKHSIHPFSKPSKVSEHSFHPLTMELRPDTVSDFLAAAVEKSGGKFSSEKPFCLVGLHTCGDLGSTALRLFSQVPSAMALCVVPCCYHHISERGVEEGDAVVGFPMSSLLKDICCHIGRNGRMLACQTINKFTDSTSGQSLEGIYWRALLQVYIARQYPEVYKNRSKDITVGRLRHVPKDFISYVHVALHKIGITEAIGHLSSDMKVTDRELSAMEDEYHCKKKHLETFLKIRGVLAPCIESLIILDRLLYLKEQVIIKSAELNMLFRPIISPRCTAIISCKL